MSRQRHESRRSENRATPAAQKEGRQTRKPTASGMSAGTPGVRKKRASSRSPQLVVMPPVAASTPAANGDSSPSAKPSVKSNAKAAANSPVKTANRRAKATARQAPAARASASAEMSPLAAAVSVDQVPEIPEVPESPQTPEIPEMPDTPDVPEMPAVPDTPEQPEMPEVPETPEQPEIPEVPEVPETPEVPEVPETPVPPRPEQPTEPTEPPEPVEPEEPHNPPDNPAVQATDVPVDTGIGAVTDGRAEETPFVPGATERRMPTLAVMAHPRRSPPNAPAAPDESATAQTTPAEGDEESAVVAADSSAATVAVHGAHQAEDARARAEASEPGEPSASEKDDQEGETDAATTAHPASVTPAAKLPQQTSVITRPDTSHGSQRRKVPRPPNLIWESDPHLPHLPWPARRVRGDHPQPLPPANLVAPVVVAHALLAALLALVGALIALGNSDGLAGWMLAGAIIAGVGGAAAYAVSEVGAVNRLAPSILVASQLALLIWAMLIFGPRASLLALIPALVEITLLMSGSLLASIFVLGTLLIYACFAGLSLSIGLAPVGVLNTTESVMLDVVCVVVGMLAALWLLLAIQSGRERAQAIARARRHEADVLRNLVTQFRQEAQDDTGKLESALIQALKGRGIGPIPTEGMYRLLAETIMDTASRLEVLQRDREERLRLEGSLRVVIRAVERQWLGVEPEWPAHTGTALDELVALLRTPPLDLTYQAEVQSPSITPRLIPIPTLAVERDTPPPTPISRPLSGSSWLSSRRRLRRPELFPLPAKDDDHRHAGLDAPHDAAHEPSHEPLHEPSGDPGENAAFWNALGHWPTQDDD